MDVLKFAQDIINGKDFSSGASASITGNYLTSKAHANIRSDREMLIRIGRKVR